MTMRCKFLLLPFSLNALHCRIIQSFPVCYHGIVVNKMASNLEDLLPTAASSDKDIMHITAVIAAHLENFSLGEECLKLQFCSGKCSQYADKCSLFIQMKVNIEINILSDNEKYDLLCVVLLLM